MYGSELVTIVADATAPGGLGTFGWDDEGVAAQAVPLIQNGRFVGYLSSRETAPRVGRASGGAMRADGWNRIPLIRMTNVNMLPVPGMSLDDIVADTDDGLYLDQPQLVDRRPPAELPVRDRGRLRDQERQEGPPPSRTRPTPGSPRSSGAPATRSATPASYVMLGRRTAARASRRSRRRSGMPCRAPASATSRWVSASGNTAIATTPEAALALAEDVLERAPEGRRDRGRGPRRRRRLGAHPLRQQRDPPERGGAQPHGQPPPHRGSQDRGGLDRQDRPEGLRSLVNRASAIARSCEELEDWAGLPAPSDGARVVGGTVTAWADAPPRPRPSSAPRARGPSSPPRRRRAPSVRLVLHRRGGPGRRQLGGLRAAERRRRRSCSRSRCRPTAAPATPRR